MGNYDKTFLGIGVVTSWHPKSGMGTVAYHGFGGIVVRPQGFVFYADDLYAAFPSNEDLCDIRPTSEWVPFNGQPVAVGLHHGSLSQIISLHQYRPAVLRSLAIVQDDPLVPTHKLFHLQFEWWMLQYHEGDDLEVEPGPIWRAQASAVAQLIMTIRWQGLKEEAWADANAAALVKAHCFMYLGKTYQARLQIKELLLEMYEVLAD